MLLTIRLFFHWSRLFTELQNLFSCGWVVLGVQFPLSGHISPNTGRTLYQSIETSSSVCKPLGCGLQKEWNPEVTSRVSALHHLTRASCFLWQCPYQDSAGLENTEQLVRASAISSVVVHSAAPAFLLCWASLYRWVSRWSFCWISYYVNTLTPRQNR